MSPDLDRGAGLPPLLYLFCPACAAVTPTAWSRTPEPGDPNPNVEGCCAPCGTVIVCAPAEAHTGLDAETRHSVCRAVVRHPAAASVVRCTTRGPGVLTDGGCGADFPAASGGRGSS